MIKVGVLGATGYMGGEVLRILYRHPDVSICWATSRQPAPIEYFHPNLYGSGIKLIHPDEITACDVVFIALPTSKSIEYTVKLLSLGCKVIDLGAAFRLRDKNTWETVYAQKHAHWPITNKSVYGITELHLEKIRHASVIANPGCFSSAAILALAPLMQEQLVDLDHIVINGLSGTAGMGATASRATHHAEIGNNLIPYNVVDHRHSYEIEQELTLLAKQSVSVHFTPVYVPVTRGILNTSSVFLKNKIKRNDLLDLYRRFYREHPFTLVYDQLPEAGAEWQYRAYPWISNVNGSNYCQIGLDIDKKRNRLVVMSVLDSLGKGGAQVGIENMNIMFGLERNSGLETRSCHPA